jgi:hypothetical protein
VGKIIPYSGKHKTSKGMCYLLKYGDIEACFAPEPEKEIDLSVWFWDAQDSHKKIRDQNDKAGRYRVVEGEFDPEKVSINEGALYVRFRVYPVPLLRVSADNLNRSVIHKILFEQLHEIIPKGRLTTHRWELEMNWLVNEAVVECRRKIWTGLREDIDMKMLIPLECVKVD